MVTHRDTGAVSLHQCVPWLPRGKTPGLHTLFLAKQPREQREDYADDDAGCNGKIEAEVFLLDGDVSGHFSNKRNLAAEHEQPTGNNQNNADDYQRLAKGIEFAHIVSQSEQVGT